MMVQPDNSSQGQPTPEQTQSPAGCLLRLYWMIFGYLLAVLCGVSIVNHHGDFSFVDVIYWLALGGVLLARWVDISRYQGTRTDGQPATMRDWKVHAILTVVGGVIGWVLIHWVRLSGWW
ncbi:MAG: hypothetical protein H5U08_13555 [Thermogutta sp.]|uniref:hypothetical protein n=1 Tax=Thermogutta sp. TaxID=1962930 RepID=UPI0019A542F0|nr:hypothetical protein [Thermogutta sp.]MBC7353382.1 hypothetical protein [Thermogutta sp.]